MDYTRDELMTVVPSRALPRDGVCFVGIGAPSAACNLALRTHAPDLVLIYESGTIQARPDVLPLSIGDGELCETALTTVSVSEMFRYWLQGGHIQVGFLGAAQIDRFANINTTVVGRYDSPKVRLPGAGGAPEIASQCHQVLVTVKHSTRTFVETVDFVTSLGHGRGPGDRRQHGVHTEGPTLIITDLCLMRPDPGSRELVVTALHEGVQPAEVAEATGWPVRFADGLDTTPPPTGEELRVLRDLHACTKATHGG